jgi:Pyrimidine dimer DNA glycosylase
MRLWTLHPKYLDQPGLVALWREALLARAVLKGETRGYRHHPQLIRFRSHPQPVGVLNRYLGEIHVEAQRRGYRFDSGKLARARTGLVIAESSGQLAFEWAHLLRKLQVRDPHRFEQLSGIRRPDPHPLFRIAPGPIGIWERGAA